MSGKNLQQATQSARCFIEQRFPDASLGLLCGSWARHNANEDSDCHTQIAQAAIDSVCGWRGERKTLRRALAEAAPDLVDRLDDGLVIACHGDRQLLLDIGHEVLNDLGGCQRTYLERY